MPELEKLINESKVVGVVDLHWGDSGKGRVVDWLASRKLDHQPIFQIVYRPNGGPNTGHTTVVGEMKHVSHLIPSAALIPGIQNFIGKAVAFEPRTYLAELASVRKINPEPSVFIDSSAHVIMPWHIALDNLRETINSEGKIGTTGKGVGPCMETKDARKGFVTIGMLTDEEQLRDVAYNAIERVGPELLSLALKFKNHPGLREKYSNIMIYLASIELAGGINLTKFFNDERIDVDEIVKTYLSYGEELKESLVNDVAGVVKQSTELISAKTLVEGTQGALLDREHGTYPFVTAGNVTRPGLEHDAGIFLDLCISVAKAYCTRVGSGPFPTEIVDRDLTTKLREAGNEYGASTGRPRRVGWFDLPATNYALDLTYRPEERRVLALTKLDVLAGFKPVICTDYKVGEDTTEEYNPDEIQRATMNRTIDFGEIGDLKNVNSLKDLQPNTRDYVHQIEQRTESEILFIGKGPERDQVILK